MVEAYLGAIFVDSEFNFSVAEDFFTRYLQRYFEDMSIYDTFANKHPTVEFPLYTRPRRLLADGILDSFTQQIDYRFWVFQLLC
jgi:dsRNA-specific ribonuclease